MAAAEPGPLTLIRPRRCLGVDGQAPEAVVFADDGVLAYVCGAHIVINTLEDGAQALLPCSADATAVTALAACPQSQLLAVAEASGGKPCLAVFDLRTQRRRRVVTLPPGADQATSFVSAALSADGKLLAAVTDGPGWQLLVWAWERSKLLASVKAVAQTGDSVVQVRFRPAGDEVDAGSPAVSVVGAGTCATFRLEQAGPAHALKAAPLSLGKRDCHDYTAQAWVPGDAGALAVGTAAGEVLIIRDGYVRQTVQVADAAFGRIQGLTRLQEGVAVATARGGVALLKRHTGAAPDGEAATAPSQTLYTIASRFELGARQPGAAPAVPLALCAEPTGGKLACLLAPASQVLLDTATGRVSPLAASHSGAVVAVATCASRAVAASVGAADGALRITHLATGRTLLAIECGQGRSARSLALHPDGHAVLLGFQDSLRLAQVLADGCAPLQDFPTSSPCDRCAFSHGGQYFAAGTEGAVHVFSTYTRAAVATLRGHGGGGVRSLTWAAGDSALMAATAAGVWEWSLRTGALVRRYATPAEDPLVAAAYQGSSSVVAATAAGRLLELSSAGDETLLTVAHAVDTEASITALAATEHAVFASTSSGAVMAFPAPLEAAGRAQRRCGLGATTCLALAPDGKSLVCGSADGSLTTFSVGEPGEEADSLDAPTSAAIDAAADVVLVPTAQLRALRQQLEEFDSKLRDSVAQQTDALRASETSLQQTAQALSERAAAAEADGKERAAAWEAERAAQQAQHARSLQAAEQAFERRLGVMDDKLSAQLRQETVRCEQLAGAAAAAEAELQRRTAALAEQQAAAIGAATAAAAAETAQQQRLCESLQQEYDQARQRWERERRELAVQADEEVQAARAAAETQLADERRASQRLRGEAGLHRQRAEEQGAAAREAAAAAGRAQGEAARLQADVLGLRRDLAGVRAELARREEALAEKDALVREVTDRERVLEARCAGALGEAVAARAGAAPLAAEAAALRGELSDARAACQAATLARSVAELAAGESKQREGAAQREAQRRQAALDGARRHLRRVQNEIAAAAAAIQSPAELKAAVVALYQAHAADPEGGGGGGQGASGADDHEEQRREREHLKASVARLRQQVEQGRHSAAAEKRRLVAENARLVHAAQEAQREAAAGAAGRGRGGAAADQTKRSGGVAVEVEVRCDT